MKYVTLMLYVILFISCKSLSSQKQIEYKIYKIEKLNSYYLVYCEKDGEKYKIISRESDNEDIKTYKKIKIGASYNLKLVSYPDYSKNTDSLTGFSPLVNCFTFDRDTSICKEKGINGLYTTKNLIGLYYIKK